MFNSSARSQNGIGRNPQLLRDFIRRLKTDAWHILGEAIWILANLLDRLLAVKFVNANGPPTAHPVRMEKHHDLANEPLFDPRIFNFSPAPWSNPTNFL